MPEVFSRIRVRFSKAIPIKEESLRRLWVSIPDTCATIADLTQLLPQYLEGPADAAIVLSVRGYALPSSELVRLFTRLFLYNVPTS